MFNHGVCEFFVGSEQSFDNRGLSLIGVFIFSVCLCDALSDYRRGDVATGVATHAIGNKEKVIAGITRVLVALANSSNIRGRKALSLYRHSLLRSQLENGLADSHGGVELDSGGSSDSRTVKVCSVCRIQILKQPVIVD